MTIIFCYILPGLYTYYYYTFKGMLLFGFLRWTIQGVPHGVNSVAHMENHLEKHKINSNKYVSQGMAYEITIIHIHMIACLLTIF